VAVLDLLHNIQVLYLGFPQFPELEYVQTLNLPVISHVTLGVGLFFVFFFFYHCALFSLLEHEKAAVDWIGHAMCTTSDAA
jgi:fatty acid desaturase